MSLFHSVKQLLRSAFRSIRESVTGTHDIEPLKVLAAQPLVRQLRQPVSLNSLREAEFKVFSQFGDDGIIQYLINAADLSASTKIFIEFGVQDYLESNTRFLLLNDNWRGLVMDASGSNIGYIQNSDLYWRHDLTAVCAFVDVQNANRLFSENGFIGDIGILSIDIDGNDYWIWKAIDVVNPAIVIVEYNSTFGAKHAITIPYSPRFDRSAAHYSNLYWGCSLKALELLGKDKGYVFVGSNSAGNNAYFVRKDRLGTVKPSTVEADYVQARFRESRDQNGNLTFVPPDRRMQIIGEMPVYDVEHDVVLKLRGYGNTEI